MGRAAGAIKRSACVRQSRVVGAPFILPSYLSRSPRRRWPPALSPAALVNDLKRKCLLVYRLCASLCFRGGSARCAAVPPLGVGSSGLCRWSVPPAFLELPLACPRAPGAWSVPPLVLCRRSVPPASFLPVAAPPVAAVGFEDAAFPRPPAAPPAVVVLPAAVRMVPSCRADGASPPSFRPRKKSKKKCTFLSNVLVFFVSLLLESREIHSRLTYCCDAAPRVCEVFSCRIGVQPPAGVVL